MFRGAREWLSGIQSGQDARAPQAVPGCAPQERRYHFVLVTGLGGTKFRKIGTMFGGRSE